MIMNCELIIMITIFGINMVKKEVRKPLCALCLLCALCANAQRMDDVAEHSKYIQAVDEYVPAPV